MHHEVQHVWSADEKNKTSERNSCVMTDEFLMWPPQTGGQTTRGWCVHNAWPVSGERLLLRGQKRSRTSIHYQKSSAIFVPNPCHVASHTPRSWGLWPVVHHMALRQTQSGVMTSEQATVRSHVTDSPHVLPSQEHHGKMTNSCRALAPQRLQKLLNNVSIFVWN